MFCFRLFCDALNTLTELLRFLQGTLVSSAGCSYWYRETSSRLFHMANFGANARAALQLEGKTFFFQLLKTKFMYQLDPKPFFEVLPTQ